MIFSKQRDPRLVTVRRGGTLRIPIITASRSGRPIGAQHVLHYFEQVRPSDDRPRRAIELARAWARGEITMTQARTAAFANAAAREVSGAAKQAARAAARLWRYLTYQLMNWVQQLTRSACARRPLKESKSRLVA